ncbi:hypothetical protein [Rhodococcus sp. IEGM 1318]|nr:hypothetical protein [Rhodococcus sp. IEGM 1318]MDV8009461.1 hypothetical protein [Rhodococcus sp. IEGM 1318]
MTPRRGQLGAITSGISAGGAMAPEISSTDSQLGGLGRATEAVPQGW